MQAKACSCGRQKMKENAWLYRGGEKLFIFTFAFLAVLLMTRPSSAVFISCDEKLLKKCARYGMNTWCCNPVAFCEKEGLK